MKNSLMVVCGISGVWRAKIVWSLHECGHCLLLKQTFGLLTFTVFASKILYAMMLVCN